LIAGLALLLALPAKGAILPEDRLDVMYHGYDGGGLKVDGPALLVRKAYKDKVSVWGSYLVDMISSASIDVVATASEYTEERTEFGAGADYLHGKTMMSAFFMNSWCEWSCPCCPKWWRRESRIRSTTSVARAASRYAPSIRPGRRRSRRLAYPFRSGWCPSLNWSSRKGRTGRA
jgi:hypothetical protein